MKVGIIGAGASGLFAALLLSKKGFDVEVFEKEDKVGKKLLQTGNGKCNFLNTHLDASFYNDPKFAYKVFGDNPYKELKKCFDELGISSYEDEQGRVYPRSNSASSFLELLVKKSNKVNIHTNCEIINVKSSKNGYLLNDKYYVDYLIIAIGSPAHLKEYKLDLLKNLDLEVEEFSPRLVPVNVAEKNLKTLEGYRLRAKVSVINDNKVSYSNNGEVLFKDKGLSGIVIFSASRYLNNGSKIVIDLVPDLKEKELKSELNRASDIESFLLTYLPKPFVKVLVKEVNNNNVVKTLKNWEFTFVSFGEMLNAQIARGGIKVNELKDTLELKKHPGVYAMGEVINIDGECGGFNLSFAWASALLVSTSINCK